MQGPAVDRPDLGLEQRGHEERVLSELNRLNTRIIRTGRDRKAVSSKALDIRRREAEVTPMERHERCTASERVHPSSWNRRDGALLRNETAGQPIDHERLRARSRLGVIRISEARHIPSELDDGVLKPAACPEERLS
jgi:hypothetical protein